MTLAQSLLGRGIYGITEAARLVSLPESRVRRWVRGYHTVQKQKRVWMPPLVGVAHPSMPSTESLSFADLIEVLYLEHFTTCGVRVRALRRVMERAKALYQTPHPFGTHRFVTDGGSILEQLADDVDVPSLLNILSGQMESRRLVETMLRGDLDFDQHDIVKRWWPLKRDRDVVVDPGRRFGAPISDSTGIPTSILYRAYRAEKSYRSVASWHEVPWQSVRDAVVFEQRLVA